MALCFSGYSNAQDYTSDNLIQNNNTSWQGCYSQTQGAFWGGVSGGPCPGVDSNGQIIFSWGTGQLSQSIAINSALNAAGTGLRIDGYNYSWWTKNSNINGQQPGSYDPYSHINVTLRNTSGQILVEDFYPYGYHLPNWTQFSGTRIYDNPYSLASVGTLTLSVHGRDQGFWAGYYGPEYRDFDLRLRYSVDPCVTDPLSSASCPGYAQALLASISTTTSEPIVETAPVVANEPIQEFVSASSSVQQASVQQSSQSAPTQSASASSEQSGSRVSTSTILSIVSREQSRIGALERATVETSVEQSATQALQATQDAESIAAASQAESISIGIINQESSQSGGAAPNFSSSDSASSSASLSGSSGPRGADTQSIAQSQNEETRNDMISGFSATDILKQETNVSREETQREQKTETVRQNVPNNELAGNVTLASLGATPQGFQAYSIGMPDASFYAPREIYRNQRTVDNPAGRRLFSGSDRMHQEMVDQQYKR